MLTCTLFRGDAAEAVVEVGDEDEARRVVDRWINDIHTGVYGHGTFSIHANHTVRFGLFAGSFLRHERIVYPKLSELH